MKKKYISPKITLKKLKINFFLRTSRKSGFSDYEGVLLAGCSCVNGVNSGLCVCDVP